MLFAKVKGTKNNPPQHRILASDENSLEQFNFYFIPNIIAKVKFNPDRRLESEEWYYVELNPEQISSMINPYILNEQTSGDLNKAVQSDYESIEVVYKVEESRAIFTKITDGYRVKNRTLLKFHDLEQVQVVQEHDSILFNGDVHAYYNGAGKLYFRDFGKIRSMFRGIDVFYREATQEEKRKFLDDELFDAREIDVDHIGQRDSARIAMVLNDEIINFEDTTTHENIIAAAQKFSDITELEITDTSKIVLNDTNDLKRILNIILSRYYVSEITGQKMESYGSAAVNLE